VSIPWFNHIHLQQPLQLSELKNQAWVNSATRLLHLPGLCLHCDSASTAQVNMQDTSHCQHAFGGSTWEEEEG
jgi:hypothetical protein